MSIYQIASKIKQDLSSQHKSRCSCCNKFKTLMIECQLCGKAFYCSSLCKNVHSSIHAPLCKLNKPKLSQKLKTGSSIQKKGLTGLQNLENTCYMNSCLQCLSNTVQLTQYFLKQSYKKQINNDNQLGTFGKLAQEYGAFVQEMWSGKNQTFRPTELKKIIGDKNPQFRYFYQQDANLFFTTLVDLIHEDLNRVKGKPYKPSPNVYGKKVEDAARISWLHYFSRNQSIITDIMTGLFKSTLYCQECKRQSLTFDTFTEVSLPIPNFVEQKQLTFFVLYKNFRKPTLKSTIEYRHINQDQIVHEAKKRIGETECSFKMYLLSENKQIMDCETIQRESFEEEIKQQRIFLIQFSKTEEPIINKKPVTCFFSRKINIEFNNTWVKRPFFIDLKSQTAESFTITILKYLYKTVYKFPQRKTIFGYEGKCYDNYQDQILKKQKTEEKLFKLILLRTIKRQGKCIIYDLKKFVQISGAQPIYEGVKKLIEASDLDQNIEEKFELTIQILDSAFKYFDFQRLHDGMQKQKLLSSASVLKNFDQKQEKQITLQECLDAFGSQQNLNSDNLWYCSWCERSVRANKKLSIYRTPDILVFVINRFKLRQDGRREKNTTSVKIPLDLDLQRYVVDNKPISCFVEQAKKKCIYESPAYQMEVNLQPIQKFQLYAFIHHKGELNNGHYTAYARKQQRWYFFNDMSVEQVDQGSIDWKNAYMLFYTRNKS